MNRRGIQLFFILLNFGFSPLLQGDLSVGQTYTLKFSGLNGESLSTADGHVSIVVVVTRPTWTKAQQLGDRVPDACVGDSVHRLITVVKFGQHSSPVRSVLTAGAKHRLSGEAKRIQPRYDARKLTRNPRDDIFAVADFDGVIAGKLGVEPEADFRAFIFGKNGQLLARWKDVPTAEELAAVLKPARE